MHAPRNIHAILVLWCFLMCNRNDHNSEFIMSAMASQIPGVSIVCSIVYSFRRRSKTTLAFVKGIHRLDCLFNRLFIQAPIKDNTGFCEGNPPVTGGFPSQRASNAGNVSIWWRHHPPPPPPPPPPGLLHWHCGNRISTSNESQKSVVEPVTKLQKRYCNHEQTTNTTRCAYLMWYFVYCTLTLDSLRYGGDGHSDRER